MGDVDEGAWVVEGRFVWWGDGALLKRYRKMVFKISIVIS
jgi:hypothetical protein